MTTKKRLLLLSVIIIAMFVAFSAIIIYLFNYINNNPIDAHAIQYIRNSTDIQEKYGEIIHVGKNLIYETQKDESIIKSPYTIETAYGRVIVYVTLVKTDGEFLAEKIEIIEEIPNGQKK